MADVSIDSSVSTSTARGMRSVVFTTADIGYWFYIDGNDSFVYSKTTDGGATWGGAVAMAGAIGGGWVAFDVWFDQWTPGDSGTQITCWFFNTLADRVYVQQLNTATDTIGSLSQVFIGASAVAGRGAFVSGTKTRSGYFYCAYDLDAGAERGLHRTTGGIGTWSAELSGGTFVEATLDDALLFPASNTGDDNDCFAVYSDYSGLAITMKRWESLSGIAQESAQVGQQHLANPTDLVGQHGYSASVRHSDGKLILVKTTEYDSATSDTEVHEIGFAGGVFVITAKTNITTDIDDHYYPQVFIDQLTDDIYVAYNGKRDGSENLGGLSSAVYYTKSTDGGTSWSAGDTAYSETSSIRKQVWTPLMGPRFYVGWFETTNLRGNKVNSIEFIAPAGLPASDDFAGTGPLTTDWTIASALSPSRVSDEVVGFAGGYAHAWWNADVFPDNQFSQIKLVVASAVVGCTVRASGSGSLTGYVLYALAGSSGAYLSRIDAGSETSLTSFFNLWSVGDVIRMEVVGDVIECFQNGVLLGTHVDSTHTSGAAGFFLQDIGGFTTPRADDWSGGALASASAALTGTATASITETDIVAGGKTIILTLTGDTWIPA